MPRAVVTSRRLDVTAICALSVAGIAFRAPGLTSADLWFDDAWAALPAHESLATALRMVVTTPIYTLGMRWWIEAGPAATWWDQLPALVFGVAGITAVYLLVCSLGYSRLAAFGAAAAIAAGPVTVAYSTRVKEYPADLLLACLLLWLADRWRRAPTRDATLTLAAAGVLSLWISASTAAVVGGAAAVVVVSALARRELRREAAILVGTLVAGSFGLWLAFLRHVPSQLRTNWRTHGYLFGYSSGHHVLYEFQQTFSGLAHGLLGVPISWTPSTSALRALPMLLAVATLLALVALIGLPITATVRSRGRDVGPLLASAASIVLAIVGTLTGVAPLGDGRTDESLYPALLLLLVGAATSLARAATASDRARQAARVATASLVAVVAVVFGAAHVAEYPPTGLSHVFAELQPRLLPGDVVVVDGYESFTWADEDLEPWRVSFRQGPVPWPMGFHVVSENPTYVLSSQYLQPDRQIARLSTRTRRLWYVGPTVGGYSNDAPQDLWAFPYPTPILHELSVLGWRGVQVCCQAPGAFAWLFVYKPVLGR